ncbi:YeeE/YedE family protein [Hwanghaeella sp.]|uniref:YeeE/YedE family protein n=1 Tax=Hwanghaeella sp. TaxID=2605943 RepID=UPI003CCBBA6C
MLEEWLASEIVSDPAKACLGGFAIGLAFGAFAQASRFCLRSACLEFWRMTMGRSVAVWLIVFGAALTAVQVLFLGGWIDASEVRQLSSVGTLSGAIVGGLMFGIGMILARGCASRLLVLSGTGNMRALVTGLIVTVVAQAALSGVLSPLRVALSSLWSIGPEARNLMQQIPEHSGIVLGIATLMLAVWLAARERLGPGTALISFALGLTIAAGWGFTATLSRVSFSPVAINSVSFTGPSADTLMALITSPSMTLEFSLGLVPGVFAGSFLSAILRREFKMQVFDAHTGMMRYLAGAVLMGFGGMLAGGCAVGAGVTGGSVMSLTAWAALFCMWVGAGLAIGFESLKQPRNAIA